MAARSQRLGAGVEHRAVARTCSLAGGLRRLVRHHSPGVARKRDAVRECALWRKWFHRYFTVWVNAFDVLPKTSLLPL